jgi:hypothetical protein
MNRAIHHVQHSEILAAVSSTVSHVEHMAPQLEPGARVHRAHVTFQTCGHDYVWHDWSNEGFPKPGDVVMCAVCIDALVNQ